MQLRTRREVLTAMGFTLGSLAMRSSAVAQADPRIHFGTQLNAFPIQSSDLNTFMDALAQVKQIGYKGFEVGYRNLQPQFATPADARAKIESSGLFFFGIHIFMDNAGYDPHTRVAPASLYEDVARGGAALGAHHLILSGLPAIDTAGLRAKIDGLNKAGAYAKAHGIKLAYHNHWPEFQSRITNSPNGEMDALYTQTDPELVHFVLDCGHAFRGGANVPAFLRQYHQRIVACHLRDYKRGPENTFRLTTLGSGDLPLRQIADTLKAIHWSGWAETEEEREDHAQTGAAVLVPAFKAMTGAFA
jgi:inosose dehydratase